MKLQPTRKYGNIPDVVDGITFDSRWEAARYRELALLQRAGEIRHLRVQVPFPLVVNDVHVCTYVADFTYEEQEHGRWVTRIEDTKSAATRKGRAYRIKVKLLAAILGLHVRETVKPSARRSTRSTLRKVSRSWLMRRGIAGSSTDPT